MSIITHKITPNDIRNLLPLLSERDQAFILMVGVRAIDSHRLQAMDVRERQDSLRTKIAMIRSACEKLGMSTKELLNNPLDAPIEILDIPSSVRKLLESRGNLQRVRDVYRLKLTISACYAAGASKSDVMELDTSLKQLGLTQLQNSGANSAIYRFCDPAYADRLDKNEILLLKQREWGNADPRDVADAAGIPGAGMIWPIIDIAKKKLEAH